MPGPRDLLVRVQAVSVNPVDTKVRARVTPAEGQPHILGYDAVGLVEAVGPEVRLFRPGDAVFYAGALGRPGTNAELHCVDERIVGHKPAALSAAEAAALPLTAITAWEALFDRLDVGKPVPGGCPVDPDHRWGGRRRLDRDAARPPAHGPDRDHHRLASRDRRLEPRSRRPSRHRPHQTVGRRGRGAGLGRTGLRVLDHQHRPASHRDRGTDRPAGPLRPDRRS
ncbi:protein of unknown function [Methylorubrum extorquens]|uniref:Alcohol dehydrogenase-like N-terminal domain-containing protein n=1 Tax=Methylorubrum extorquens TaxID=408 RepID=A0A2N9AU72_METEX|nr:protein of unknown function [Methylorubrum extorquens]